MIVDSSVWLEIAFGGPLAEKCLKETLKKQLYVPTLVVYEVYKKARLLTDEAKALEIISSLSASTVIDMTREVALLAADLSVENDLAMADSIVLAHARYLGLRLLTLDNDFATIADAIVIRK